MSCFNGQKKGCAGKEREKEGVGVKEKEKKEGRDIWEYICLI